MKILVISLLRLGDILLHKNLIASINAEYPNSTVDFLINENFASAKSILNEIDTIHLFPRDVLQNILVEREQSPVAAFQKLGEFVSRINAQKYDLILDATHNRLSVQLCRLLEAKEVRSARTQKNQNPWEDYFNNQFSQVNKSRFHYIDVLSRSLRLNPMGPMLAKKSDSKKIVFQVLTSDSKKNWGLDKFKQLISQTQNAFSDFECVVLCSSAEKAEICKILPEQNYDVRALNLLEARNLLTEASVLVSGDTSIQHLAAEVGCKIISIFIGSADATKTAPYLRDTLVLKATSSCYPCKHSEACSQTSHLCAQTISVNDVFNYLSSTLKGEPVKANESGPANRDFEKDFERLAWSFYLSQEWQSSIPGYGSAVFELLNEWGHRYSLKAINRFVMGYQTRILEIESAIAEGQGCFSAISKTCIGGSDSHPDGKIALAKLKKWHADVENQFNEQSDSFLKLKFALHKEYEANFGMYREIKNSLDEPLNLNLIRKQILVNLMRSLSEKGEMYGRDLTVLS